MTDRALIAAMGGGCDRVYSPSFDLIGPAAAAANIPTLGGVDPFQLSWSASIISEAAGVPPEGYSVTAPPVPPGESVDMAQALRPFTPRTEELAALGVRWVTAHFPIDAPGLTSRGQVAGVYVYETPGGIVPVVTPGDASGALQAGPQPTRLPCDPSPNVLINTTYDLLSAPDPAVLVLPEAWAPGWWAWVDGQRTPVQVVGGVLVGVPVPTSGTHHVEVAYRPAADFAGMAISGATVLALIAGWALRRRRAA